MARDKLITIRIEEEKRKAFNNLAKSQNTDTASLLYDFINQCLSGEIDIKLVTGKKQWIDKIDNQIDSDRIDKLEATTQRIDNRLDTISKKLNDWIEAIDDRLTDSDQGLSEKIISLEHRLKTLSIQLDSQEIDSEIDRIDTDSQKDSQGENPDMGTVATVEAVYTDSSIELGTDAIESLTPEVPPSPPSPPSPLDAIEGSEKKIPLPDILIGSPIGIDKSVCEPDKGAIGPVPGDSSPIELGKGEGMNAAEAFRYVTEKGVKVSEKTLSNWVKLKEIPITDKGDKVSEYLVLRGKLYYPNPD